jgi:membrane protease subunit HflK
MFSLYNRVNVERDGRGVNTILPTPFGILVAIYLFVIIYSTWFTVGKGEQAVVQRFGAYEVSHGPGGPYFKLPWPIDDYTIVEVQKAGQIPIGFKIDEKTGVSTDIPEQSEVLTGDLNTVMVDSVLQFQRADAKRWLFVSEEPEKMLFLLAQSALRRAVAARSFDEILTTDRVSAQTASQDRIRELADQMGLGVNIIAHQIQDTHPPKEVAEAFRDVTNAGENKQQKIQEARGYSNGRKEQARGEALQVIAIATGYKASRVNEAKGAAARFEAVYAQYKGAPELTRDRMRYEALESVLAGKQQLIDMGQAGGSPLLKLFDVGTAKAAAVAPATHK